MRQLVRALLAAVITIACCVSAAAAALPVGAMPSSNWSSMPLTAERLSFASDTAGWACGSLWGGGDGVMRTTDGGASWTTVKTGWAEWWTDVSALSADDAWVCGFRWNGDYSLQIPSVSRTTDGGATWTEHLLPAGAFPSPRDLVMFDATHGWVVSMRTLYRTDDGGVTWTPQAEPAGVEALYFLDADHGWALTGAGQNSTDTVYRTSDGGQHWSAAKPAVFEDALFDVVFADAQHGVLVGDSGKVAVSADGGATWSHTGAITDDAPVSGLHAAQATLCAVDALHFWAVAGTGDIYATDDGGHTWFPQFLTFAYGGSNAGDIVVRGELGWTAGSLPRKTVQSGLADLRPPVTGLSVPAYINTPLTVQLTPRDEGSGVASTWYRRDREEWQQGVSVLLDTSVSGEHWLAVASQDVYGNWEQWNSVQYRVDVTGPLLAWSPEADVMMDHWTNRESRIGIRATDEGYYDGCGATAIEVSADGGSWKRHEGTVHSIVTRAPRDHSNDGVHSITARGVDAIGNLGGEETHTVAIDTRAPKASAPKVAYARTGGTGTVRFKISDARPCFGGCSPRIVVKTLKGRKVAYIQPKTWIKENALVALRFACPLKAGKYRFSVTAGDGAGNTTPKAATNYLIVRAARLGMEAQSGGVPATLRMRPPDGMADVARRAVVKR